MYFPRICLLIVFQCSVVLGFIFNSSPCARARSLPAACGPDASPVIGADAATNGWCVQTPTARKTTFTDLRTSNGHSTYAWNSADNEGHIEMDEYRGSIRQWVRRADEGVQATLFIDVC
ncbi:hypothetical protein BDN71DRAFT_160035 [Pleurotus eryngii]|uniref:Secreted protein n=1 Tax=Pleurotus eryngii TaxID=5323 RepID=A0A9P6D333_PLEER|nr:hypothetical protein BDN71DRAFT_160035 [Pleurotus eryngii]